MLMFLRCIVDNTPIPSSLGSSGMLAVLATIGYVANEAQSGASQQGIALLQTAIPGAFALLARTKEQAKMEKLRDTVVKFAFVLTQVEEIG